MRNILIVVDMQNDFIDGALGTEEAIKIVPKVVGKIKEYKKENIFATRDTHDSKYLETLEGRNLPIQHCLKNTPGWQIHPDISPLILNTHIFDKPCFGSVKLTEELVKLNEKEKLNIELIGLCTDICVISNAVLIKSNLPNVNISIDSSCCAGVTKESHDRALKAMKVLQINIK